MKKPWMRVAWVLGMLVASTVWAGDDLTVAVTYHRGDRYIEPINKKFELIVQPLILYICVRNNSEDSQEVNRLAEEAYSFELTDASGAVTMMKPKRKVGDAKPTGTYSMVKPKEEQVTEIIIDPETWEGIPEITPGQRQELQMRALYLNADGKTLYSPVYTLVINIPN